LNTSLRDSYALPTYKFYLNLSIVDLSVIVMSVIWMIEILLKTTRDGLYFTRLFH